MLVSVAGVARRTTRRCAVGVIIAKCIIAAPVVLAPRILLKFDPT